MLATSDSEISDTKPCIQCGSLIALNGRFCNHCGARQSSEDLNSTENKWSLLKQAGLFYGIDIIACALVSFIEFFKTFSWFLFFDILMAITAVLFFALNWTENKSLLTWRTFSLRKLVFYGAVALIGSFLVHYSVGWLNDVIFSKEVHYFRYAKGNIRAEVFVIFFAAIMPALFEELGYRGYLLQTLLKVADKEQAIYLSAFLFAIIHMSFISLFWLIPFALFLGYTRVKENTLWYGIFFHFCFNLTACMFELL
jgi:membrane protease YdiL (CAAX protease family)